MAKVNGPGQTTGFDPPVATPSLQVYNPPAVGHPHVVLFNSGASPVYLGGTSVTAQNGFYFPSGAQISLPFAPFPIYAIDGYTLGTATATLTINAVSGGTVLAAGSIASFTPGTLLQIGNAGAPNSQEVVVIANIPNTGTVTTTTPILYDHISGATVTTIASQNASSLSVNVGTT
jgi:hypothetical protein